MKRLSPVLRISKGACGIRQDTIEALLHAPDVIKALQGTLRRVKDVPRLLQRLQVPATAVLAKIGLHAGVPDSWLQGMIHCLPQI